MQRWLESLKYQEADQADGRPATQVIAVFIVAAFRTLKVDIEFSDTFPIRRLPYRSSSFTPRITCNLSGLRNPVLCLRPILERVKPHPSLEILSLPPYRPNAQQGAEVIG